MPEFPWVQDAAQQWALGTLSPECGPAVHVDVLIMVQGLHVYEYRCNEFSQVSPFSQFNALISLLSCLVNLFLILFVFILTLLKLFPQNLILFFVCKKKNLIHLSNCIH